MMQNFKYQKKWKDAPAKLEAEGEPTGWFEVTKDEMVEVLAGAYKDTELILETLHEGHSVNTPFSMFRAIEGSIRYAARNVHTGKTPDGTGESYEVQSYRDPAGRFYICSTCKGQGWDEELHKSDCPFKEVK